MAGNFLERFTLLNEREEYHILEKNISNGVAFRGTNLWVLIFAIFIASLGLNINAPAVVIGAMLISPLMGPIMGLGLGLGINDFELTRRSLSNYGFAVLVSLITSTLYFALSPLNEAHSELLARTSPSIYDVLIAFFGGLAGIVANSSKMKGNVIPGVAIATALMPPLCTAGYGLATGHWNYFFGATYLFIINTVFIAAATFFTVRLLKFPYKHLPDAKAEKRAHRMIILVLFLTLAPSLYFGYDIVERDRFIQRANIFIEREAVFADDYLLNKKVDPKEETITLTYGGREITQNEIKELQGKLKSYNLTDAKLQIQQGFAFLSENDNTLGQDENSRMNELSTALQGKDAEVRDLRSRLDSIKRQEDAQQVYSELKVNYPQLNSVILNRSIIVADTSVKRQDVLLAILDFRYAIPGREKRKIEQWIKVRLKENNVKVIIE